MSVESTTTENPTAPDSRSSIFEKTTPELRRKLDRAILNYDPASYLAIFKKYDLPAHGVSYTSFYCYARKLRSRASVHQIVDQVEPDDDSLVEALPRLIAQFLVEQIMANDNAGADTIYRLTLAHRAALENAAFVRKHRAAEIRNPQSEIRYSANPAHLSNKDLLAQADLVFARQKASLDADKAQLVADLKRTQEQLRAAGDHQAADIAALMADDPPPARSEPRPSASGSEPPPRGGAEWPANAVDSPPSQVVCTNSSIPHSAFRIPNSPPIPNPQSEIRNPVNPVNPVHSSPDAIVSTADDQFRITPEERRRREMLRAMIDFGLLKPGAPLLETS